MTLRVGVRERRVAVNRSGEKRRFVHPQFVAGFARLWAFNHAHLRIVTSRCGLCMNGVRNRKARWEGEDVWRSINVARCACRRERNRGYVSMRRAARL
jgi:hypothetical protein